MPVEGSIQSREGCGRTGSSIAGAAARWQLPRQGTQAGNTVLIPCTVCSDHQGSGRADWWQNATNGPTDFLL